MAAEQRRTTVAVFNSSPEVVEMLRTALEGEGFHTVAAHVPDIKSGQSDLLAFLADHDPPVLVYDVSPPYEENWTFLRLIQDTEAARNREFVITTTNKRALEALVGPTAAHEVIGKPYDLNVIIEAVRSAASR